MKWWWEVLLLWEPLLLPLLLLLKLPERLLPLKGLPLLVQVGELRGSKIFQALPMIFLKPIQKLPWMFPRVVGLLQKRMKSLLLLWVMGALLVDVILLLVICFMTLLLWKPILLLLSNSNNHLIYHPLFQESGGLAFLPVLL
jgi:hypothetical protein